METMRDRLIAAAIELLDRGGPAAVTLREVGRLAGVSHNAPYKHFVDKEHLLAAVAARELERQTDAGRRRSKGRPAGEVLQAMMQGYVRWGLRHPARFKLTFGAWSTDSAELAKAATAGRTAFVDAVVQAQAAGALPGGEPERLAALLQALAHGAVDLALSGHLSKTGKGHARPSDLVDDLFTYLRPLTRQQSG
jgi:AcrR family transcriptional regulator